MVKYKKEFIENAQETIIAHGCNSMGVMGSGVARIVKEKWPRAFKDYRNEYEKNGLFIGEVIFSVCADKIIANCITQQSYGRDKKQYVDYNAIRTCMSGIKEYMIQRNLNSLAMPKIGAGLGGGDWPLIEDIINKVFISNSVSISVYDPF